MHNYMNIETNSEQKQSPNCKGCKLFYGAQAYQGYCSTCYKKQQGPIKDSAPIASALKSETSTVKPQETVSQPVVQENRNKCNTCSRKLKNLGIECKCGFVFCSLHRLPEDHECTFDHLNSEKRKLEKTLIKVANGKIGMIE